MTGIAALSTGRTVLPRLTVVNSVVTVDRQGSTDEEGDDKPGRRLERYVKERWGRRQGGILALASKIGSSTETVYSWFRSDSEPSMSHLRALAEALGVKRSDLVAILDGSAPTSGDAASQDATPADIADAVREQAQAIRDQTAAINALVLALLGTQSEDVRAAVEALVDQLVSPRRDPDPVPTAGR